MDKLLFTVLIVALGYATGYPTGAPQGACETFTAHHGDHAASNSVAPYEIIVSASSVSPGGTVLVTLKGKNDEKLKGFLLQGIDSNSTPVGHFQAQSGLAQTLDCTSTSNAATHVDRDDKSSVTLEWQAPASFSGSVNFRAVVVKRYEEFWNNVRSETALTVS